MTAAPSTEFLEDLVYAARADAHDELRAFVETEEQWTRDERIDFLCSALDERRNTALHVTCANGHLDTVRYLLSLRSPQFLQNESGNTAVHWAAQNGHLEVLKELQPFLNEEIVLAKNLQGQDAIALADSRGTEKGMECAGWLLNLTPDDSKDGAAGAKEEQTGDNVAEEEAQEGVEKMTLGDHEQQQTQS